MPATSKKRQTDTPQSLLPFVAPDDQPLTRAQQVADELGQVKAQVASLKAIEDRLKQELDDLLNGQGEVEGRLFRATVSTFPASSTDWKAIAEHVGYSSQLKTAHTTTQDKTTISVKARKTS